MGQRLLVLEAMQFTDKTIVDHWEFGLGKIIAADSSTTHKHYSTICAKFSSALGFSRILIETIEMSVSCSDYG